MKNRDFCDKKKNWKNFREIRWNEIKIFQSEVKKSLRFIKWRKIEFKRNEKSSWKFDRIWKKIGIKLKFMK